MGTRLWVGNLPFDATEPEIKAIFAENGRQVASVILKSDRVTGRPAGFGFIEMASDEFAQQAVKELDGRMLRGRPMRVNEARPPGSGPGPRGPRGPRPMGAGPGGPGGGPGGGGFRRPFPGAPGAPGGPAPFGKQTSSRGRKERREREKERSEKPDVEKQRGGGGKKSRFGDDFDDD